MHKRVNKNAPQNMDLNFKAYQYFDGIDLMSIEGVSHSTIMAMMSEVGPEGFKKFQTAKRFTSWLRTEYEYLDQKRKRKVKEMRKQILKLGITANDLDLSTI